MKTKLAVFLDGGLGRVLCAIPALQELAKTVDLTVLTGGWLEAYKGSGLNVLPMGLSNQADLLKDHEIVKPEPYWSVGYRKGELNLVQAFFESLDLPVPTKETALPFATDTRGALNRIQSDQPVMVIQPFGAGGTVDPRSMTIQELDEVITLHKESYTIVILGCQEELNTGEGIHQLKDTNETEFIHYVQNADAFVGCDSSGIHIRAAVGKEHTALLSVTSGVQYYDKTTKMVREGYEDMRINPRL